MAHQDEGRSVWRVPHANALGQLLMVTGLTGFAISQPLLSVAGESPATFAFRSVEGVSLVLFALAVAFIPPLVIWGVLRLIALASTRASDIAFVVVAALLAVAAGIQIAKAFDVERAALIAVGGLLVAAVLVVAYLRVSSVDLWLRFTAILPVGAVLLFLFASPTSALLMPSSGDVAQVAAGDEPPVVFILLDEFPTQSFIDDDGAIDRDRFPNLASLVDDDFTWYRDYTVPSNQTLMSVPSVLTGTLPTDDAAVAANHPDSLFTMLAPTHDLHVYEAATKLCGLAACTANAAAAGGSSGPVGAFREMVDVFGQRISLDTSAPLDLGEFAEEVESEPVASSSPVTKDGSDEAVDRLERDVASMPTRATEFTSSFSEQGARSGLYFLHLLLPHQPWTFYPDGSRYGADVFSFDNAEWARALVEQRHLFQAQYADRLVGEMLASLRASGLYDDSMVIVTADHGIAFDEVPEGRALRDDRIPEVAYAPLFIKDPGQQTGGVSDANVTGTDLVPTIAEVTGVTVDWDVVGAPIDSEAVAARGSAKTIYNFGTRKERTPRTPIDFDTSLRPVTSRRLIASLGPDDSPIAGLVHRLGVSDLLGTPVSELGAGPGSAAATIVDESDKEKAKGGATLPTILGTVSGAAPSGDIVLVVLDGTIVSAAPVVGTRFEAMWAPGDSTQDLSRIELVLDRGGVYIQMTVA